MYDRENKTAAYELAMDTVRRRDHMADEDQIRDLINLEAAFRYARVLLPVIQMKADVYLRQN